MKAKDMFFHMMSSFTKNVLVTIKEMVTKNASLNTFMYLLRLLYNIVVSVRNFKNRAVQILPPWKNNNK